MFIEKKHLSTMFRGESGPACKNKIIIPYGSKNPSRVRNDTQLEYFVYKGQRLP